MLEKMLELFSLLILRSPIHNFYFLIPNSHACTSLPKQLTLQIPMPVTIHFLIIGFMCGPKVVSASCGILQNQYWYRTNEHKHFDLVVNPLIRNPYG